MDAVETLVDSLCKAALADFLHAAGIMLGAHLVELTEQVVEFVDGARVVDECGPVAGHGTVATLELVDDLVEIPREGQDVSVFLLRELNIDAKPGVFVAGINLVAGAILRHDSRSVREASEGEGCQGHLALSSGHHEQSLLWDAKA